MIDYTATVDRNEDVPGQPVHYTLNDLTPASDAVARTYKYFAPDVLNFPPNADPLLSKAIALEITRKMKAMNTELG